MQVVVAAHGRLKNWVSRKLLDPKNVKVLVFDEGDLMLQQDAFEDDSGAVMHTLPQHTQTHAYI